MISMIKIIVLDTNFLLIPYQFKIDIFLELFHLIEGGYDIIIPSGVKKELEKIAAGKGRNALGGRLALKILEVNKKDITFVKSEGHVDDWILNFAKQKRAIVCTNDKQLRMLSKRADLRTITMKSRSKINYI